jgi:hypothetical protein
VPFTTSRNDIDDEAVTISPALFRLIVEVEKPIAFVVNGYANVAHVAHESVPPENESGPETVVACTPPVAFVERRTFGMFETVRFEVDAVPKYPVPETVSAVEDA